MPQGFEYYRPKTRKEAIELLARPNFNAAPLIVHPRPDAPGELGVDAFVDLSLLGLDYIRESEGGSLHVGAATSLQTILNDPLLKTRTKGLINRAAWQVAPERIRNLSSLWGAIQARRGPPEFLLALLVLEAELQLQGAAGTQRTLCFPAFYEMGNNSLQKGELVIEASFARLPEAGCGWALERVARTPRDEAIVAALAIVEVEGGVAGRIRLALAGANPLPGRVETIEKLLPGRPLDIEAISRAARAVAEECTPAGDFRGSADYRRTMAEVVTRRAVHGAWVQAKNSLAG